MTVYLAGPIFGCDDAECRGWRELAKHLIGAAITTLDPMRRDYRGQEAAAAAEIVRGDLRDIEQCDVVLANVGRPTWGTSMEIAHAKSIDKPVFGFGAAAPVSPWLMYHCESLHADLEAACEQVLRYELLYR